MKTFMVRELSRQTARVLQTCDGEGGVIIQYQDGRQYNLVPRRKIKLGRRVVPRFSDRQKALFGSVTFTARQLNASLQAGKGER
jgi:hypothetical protein